MVLLPLFFCHRCRFSNSSFTAAICPRRSHLNVSFDITLIHHSNEFLIFILDSPTFPHGCSFSFPFEILYSTFSFLLCQVHVDHCVRLHRQAPSGHLLAIAIFFIQSIDCLDCQVLPFLVQSFMVSWSFISRLWIIAYSNTSLEAQFPFFAFSIFPYSAILRCCVLWIIPAKFQFSILHCGRLRIAFLHFLWISAIQSIRILFQFQFWQIHLDPICPAPIGHSLIAYVDVVPSCQTIFVLLALHLETDRSIDHAGPRFWIGQSSQSTTSTSDPSAPDSTETTKCKYLHFRHLMNL